MVKTDQDEEGEEEEEEEEAKRGPRHQHSHLVKRYILTLTLTPCVSGGQSRIS